MTRRHEPKAVIWRVSVYGPAVTILLLGVGTLYWAGWEVAVAYAMAALNMWLVARQLRTNYRSGYWAGRLDVQMERLGLKPVRNPDDEPEPWEDPMSVAELTRIRERAERIGREMGHETGREGEPE